MKKIITVTLELETDDDVMISDEFIKNDLETRIHCASNFYIIKNITTEITKANNRKIKRHIEDGEPWTYFISGVRCDCGANCYHYEYDGNTIYGVCNACERDIYIVKPEYVADELNTGVWE